MNIQGATGVLYNITGGTNLTLIETSEAAEIIRAAADEDAEIIYGTSIDESLGDAVKITLIATGFDDEAPLQPYQQPVRRHPRDERERARERERDYDTRYAREPQRPPERAPERERPAYRQPQPSRQAVSQPLMPDDDWEGESTLLRFIRER